MVLVQCRAALSVPISVMVTTLLLVYCTLFRVNPIPVAHEKHSNHTILLNQLLLQMCDMYTIPQYIMVHDETLCVIVEPLYNRDYNRDIIGTNNFVLIQSEAKLYSCLIEIFHHHRCQPEVCLKTLISPQWSKGSLSDLQA